MRVSLFWRPVLICLALVVAILLAVQWDSPKTLPKIWAVLIVFLVVAGIGLFALFPLGHLAHPAP